MPTTYGNDIVYCLKSHCGVRGYCRQKWVHFHGMLYVPEDTMPGRFVIQDSYSFSNKRRQKTKESTYFREKFGRNDFEDLNTERALGGAVTYILKYIEKH